MNPHFLYHSIVLIVGSILIYSYTISKRNGWKTTNYLKVSAIIAVLFGIFGYSNFLEGHGKNYKGTYHFSEVWHYYLGSKYYKEVSNSRLYDATASAFKEVGSPPKQAM